MLPALLAIASGITPTGEATPVGGSLTGIFSADDYPADALDLSQQGSVGVLVRIDPKGAVSDCVVTASSGSPGLDAQTCRIVWLRAKFTPARDASGTPVESTYQQSIVWRIADGDEDDDGGSSEPYTVRWIVSDWDGFPPSCRSEFSGAAEPSFAGPAPCPAYIAGIPGSFRDIAKAYDRITVEQRFTVGQPPAGTVTAADRLVGRELARLDVDAAGKVVKCKIVEATGVLPPQLPRACDIADKQYLPKKDAKGSPAPFTAYYLTELKGHVGTGH